MNDFLSGYETYNPEEHGYGNPRKWRNAFKKRMNPDEAKEYLQDRSPLEILGLRLDYTQEQLKKKYRELMLKWHPDKNPHRVEEAKKMSQDIIAAYTILSQ